MKKAVRLFVLAAAAALLAACATLTKMAYSNAAFAYSSLPPMIAWMVDDYVDLQGNQKDWVRERIERAMQWHRAEELPAYGRFLEHVLEESDEPFTVDEIALAYAELRTHYRRTVEKVLPDVAAFLLQLDARQVTQMQRKFERDNRDLMREQGKGTPEERRERRMKRFTTHLESWLGGLGGEQRELLARRYEAIPDLLEERLADRRHRQAETLRLVRMRPSREEMIAGLHRLLVETDAWRAPEYVRKTRERDQRVFEMFSALSTTLTREQRQHLQSRLRRYLQDIDRLTD